MSIHSYPARRLIGDYLSSGIGLGVTGTLLVIAKTDSIMFAVLAAIAAVFLWLGLRTFMIQTTRVELDDVGVSILGARHATLAWRDLRDLNLHFYAMNRDRAKGWMQLTLKGPDRVLKIDSKIDGFPDIVRRAAEAAAENDIELGSATANNLAHFDAFAGGVR